MLPEILKYFVLFRNHVPWTFSNVFTKNKQKKRSCLSVTVFFIVKETEVRDDGVACEQDNQFQICLGC